MALDYSSNPADYAKAWATVVRRLFFLAGLLFIAVEGRTAFPLSIDDAAVTAPKDVEIVLASSNSSDHDLKFHATTWSVSAGLLPRIEASLDGGYGWLRNENGSITRSLLDLNAGVKAHVIGFPDQPFSLAVAGTWKYPAARVNSGFGSGKDDYGFNVACTRAFSRVSLDINTGYTWIGQTEAASHSCDQVHLGTAVRWQVSLPWMFFTECAGSAAAEAPRKEIDLLLRVGSQCTLARDCLLGIAIGRSLHGANPSTVVELGLTLLR